MADEGVKGSQLPTWANTVSGNDAVFFLALTDPTPNTYQIKLTTVFANAGFNITLANSQSFSANNVVVRGTTTPANSTADVSIGQGTIFWDSNYIYVATANGHTKRASLSDF